jgi:hypothetical protein
MSDLVKRLLRANANPNTVTSWRDLVEEAADSIEQLEAALQEILDDVEPAAHNGATGAISVRAIARRALRRRHERHY